MNSTFFVTLGQFSTSNTSSQIANLTGVADEDELAQKIKNASPISGTYQVQSNGYGNLAITSANLGKVTSLALYLTDPTLNLSDPNNSANGGGGALLLELDTALTGGIGIITPQTDTSTNSFAGNYAGGWQDVNQLDGVPFPREFDTVSQGSMVANGNMSLIGVVSDPFETLTSAGTLSTGDTFTTIPQVDTAHLGSGRYTMGFDLPLTALDLDRIEAFYRKHKAPSQVDLTPLHGPEIFEMFKERGYAIAELNNVLYRRLDPKEEFPDPPEHYEIRRSPADEAEITGMIVESAFFPDGAPEAFRGLIAPLYQMENALAFVATVNGKPVACGTGLVIPEHRVFALCGAGTLSNFRGRGLQTALLRARMNLLQRMGYKVQIGLGEDGRSPYWSDAECAAIDEKTGIRLGATDGRNSNGKAVGY